MIQPILSWPASSLYLALSHQFSSLAQSQQIRIKTVKYLPFQLRKIQRYRDFFVKIIKPTKITHLMSFWEKHGNCCYDLNYVCESCTSKPCIFLDLSVHTIFWKIIFCKVIATYLTKMARVVISTLQGHQIWEDSI